MTWQELRTLYPNRWVLVEALEAATHGNQRIISMLQFVDDFGDSWHNAWAHYKMLHHTDRQREYYILHTSKETLDIGVIDAFGRIVS
jgi:hypothetical protein